MLQQRVGQVDSNKFGIRGFNNSGTRVFEVSETRNEIAGWEITPGNLQSDDSDGSIALSATSQSLQIFTGSVDFKRPKIVVGKLPVHDGTTDSPYGFAVFSGSQGEVLSGSLDNTAVIITKNIAKLAGWELVPGRLKSGTVADINGNKASIALGTGATSATGTPTANLFFVSASTNPVFYVGENFSYVDDVLTAAGWKIGKGQISSSNGQAILSGSGVLSLGSGTHGYEQANRTYIDGPGNRMSIGENFSYSSDVLTAAGWTIDTSKIKNGTDIELDASNKRLSINNNSMAFGFGVGGTGKHGLHIDANNHIYSTGEFIFGGTSQFISASNGNVEISSSNFHLTNAGDVTMQGTITAVAGEIGGFSVGAGAISGDSFFLSGSASGNEFFISSSDFNVKANGKITGSNVLFTGGVVGGFTLSDTQLSATNFTLDTSGKRITLGSSDDVIILDADEGIQVGDSTFADAEFSVDVRGNLKSTSGSIGGFNIASSTLSATNFSLDTSNKRVTLGSSDDVIILDADEGIQVGDSTFADAEFSVDVRGNLKSTSGSIGGFGLSSDEIKSLNNNLRLKSSGQITGSQVLFTGGDIGGFELTSTQINDTDDDLILKSSGQITGSNVKFDGGTIGGFTLNSTSLTQGSFLEFTSTGTSGEIRMTAVDIEGAQGFLTKYNSTGGSQGVFFHLGDADSTANSSYIQIDNRGSTDIFTISSSNFLLHNGDLSLTGDITATAGKIGDWNISGSLIGSNHGALAAGAYKTKLDGLRGYFVINDSAGTSPYIYQSSDFGSKGIQLDSNYGGTFTPRFYVGNGANRHIKYDGTLVEILTDKFFMGSGSQFISGSNGNIEISSSNFHLDRAGNVDMSGTITATAGQIAAFTIGEDTLQITSGSTITQLGKLTNTNSGDVGISISGSNTYLDISATKFQGDVFYPRFEMRDNDNRAGMYAGVIGSIDSNFNASSDEFNFVLIGNDNTTLFRAGGGGNRFAGFYFTGNTITDASTEGASDLIIRSNGQITASDATLTGTVNATGGTIGGFNIQETKLRSSSGNFIVSGSSGQITLGGGLGGSDDNRIVKLDARTTAGGRAGDGAIRISVGHATQTSAPFQVNAAGAVTGSQVLFTGGEIAGWHLDDSKFLSEEKQNYTDGTNEGTNQSTASLETGNLAKFLLESRQTQTKPAISNVKRAEIVQQVAAGAKNTIVQRYRQSDYSGNVNMTANAGEIARPGVEWSWNYNRAYDEGKGESLTISAVSGSWHEKEHGVSLTYKTGSREIIRLGKIKDPEGTPPGVSSAAPYRVYFGLSGSLETTASFGTYYGDGSNLTGVAGGGDVAVSGTPANNQLAVWTADDTIEGDADLTWDGSDMTIGDDGRIIFGGTNGGSGGGLIYRDSGGTGRYAIQFPGSDIVVLSNRASNGVVQIRANTGTSGVSGEVTVLEVQDTKVIPGADGTIDLGAPDRRWENIYSADLQLSNEGTKGNEVDGTTGSWTIQEGDEDLYLLNRKNGKKYRFKLEEII